jgi:hypothetical protein
MRAAREEFIRQKAEEAGREAVQRDGEIPSKDAFAHMKIQVFDPWLRFALLLVAGFTGVLGYWLHCEVGNVTLTVFIGVLSVAFAALSAFGKRETVEDALGAVAEFVYNRILDS